MEKNTETKRKLKEIKNKLQPKTEQKLKYNKNHLKINFTEKPQNVIDKKKSFTNNLYRRRI